MVSLLSPTGADSRIDTALGRTSPWRCPWSTQKRTRPYRLLAVACDKQESPAIRKHNATRHHDTPAAGWSTCLCRAGGTTKGRALERLLNVGWLFKSSAPNNIRLRAELYLPGTYTRTCHWCTGPLGLTFPS